MNYWILIRRGNQFIIPREWAVREFPARCCASFFSLMPLLRNAFCNASESAALFFLLALHNKNNYSLSSLRNNQSSAGASIGPIHRANSSLVAIGLLISPSGNQHVADSVKCKINFLRIAATIVIGWHHISLVFSIVATARGFSEHTLGAVFRFPNAHKERERITCIICMIKSSHKRRLERRTTAFYSGVWCRAKIKKKGKRWSGSSTVHSESSFRFGWLSVAQREG